MDSYLRIDLVISLAKEQGCHAVFPGYGFLSENANFAKACDDNGIIFLGPTATQIEEFGLKHRARELAIRAGVPTTQGSPLLSSLEDAISFADRISYPVMLKSTAGNV